MERTKLATNTKTNNTDQNGEAATRAASFIGPDAENRVHDEVTDAESNLCVRKVANWYKSLNGPEAPECAPLDLMDKHSEVYFANIMTGCCVAVEVDVDASPEADIDISNQTPGKALYLQGCLLHEAALLTDDIEQEEWLLRQARNAYVRVTMEDGELGKFQQQEAVRHIYDVDFRILTNRFRNNFYQEHFDEEEFSELIDQYERLQQGYIKEFLYWSGTDVEGQEKSHVGILFEWLTVLAYRHKVWRDCAFADTEIRLAMPREDQPAINRKKGSKRPVNRAIDAVIYYHFPDAEIETEYVQCKISRKNREYLPKITMVKAVKAKSLKRVIEAKKGEDKEKSLQRSFIKTVESIRREYEGCDDIFDTATITELQGILVGDPKAA